MTDLCHGLQSGLDSIGGVQGLVEVLLQILAVLGALKVWAKTTKRTDDDRFIDACISVVSLPLLIGKALIAHKAQTGNTAKRRQRRKSKKGYKK